MSRPLLDTLFNINCSLSSTPAILEKTRINSAIRFGLRRLANGLLPATYRRRPGPSLTGTVPVVVSMTSFPARIQKVWIVVETMLRQRQSPEKIVLWLSRDQFPGGHSQLPERLLAQQERGLDIRFVDGDIRSHKKYYYAFAEFPDRHILTDHNGHLYSPRSANARQLRALVAHLASRSLPNPFNLPSRI